MRVEINDRASILYVCSDFRRESFVRYKSIFERELLVRIVTSKAADWSVLNTIRYTVVWGQPTSQSALLFTRSWPGATSHGQLVNDRGSGIQGFSTVEFASQNLIPGKCAPDRATQSETGANKVNLGVACLLPFTQCGPPRTRSFSRSS